MGYAGILFLLICSAFISGTEVALFSLSPQDINKLNTKSPAKGKLITSLLERPKKLLATIVITNNVINIATIILFFRIGSGLFDNIAYPALRFLTEVAFITFIILLFGEVVPKLYASRRPVRFARKMAWPLYILNTLLTPVSVPLRNFTSYLHKKFGQEKTNFSVDQLSQALELTDYGDATQEEQKLLEGIVTFGNTEVRQVMSPRIDIFALEIEETFTDIMPKIIDKGFSRIPVYKDNIDQIEGVLFIKDLIPHIDKDDFEWQKIIREPFFVPENKKLDNLLKEFQGMKKPPCHCG
jgi:putative hemolysin